MKKVRIHKIHSIHFGAAWIGAAVLVGIILPVLIFVLAGKFYRGLSILGGIILLGFIIVFCIEMNQDFGKKPYYERHLKEDIPFDPDKQIAIIKSCVCTGEQLAGFKNKEDGHFTEVMLIKNEADLNTFMEIYDIREIKKEY